MLVHFDPNSLNLQIKVGLLEEYKASEEFKADYLSIEKQVAELKEKILEFRKQVVDTEMQAIAKKVEELNKPYLK